MAEQGKQAIPVMTSTTPTSTASGEETFSIWQHTWENLGSFEVLLIGFSIVALLYYKYLQDSKETPTPPRPSSLQPPSRPEPQDFTLEQLRSFDGTNGNPIYIAVQGKVYDMSSKPGFYGPNGAYHIFAGRDASRALAKGSLDLQDVENSSIADLDPMEIETLGEWVAKYDISYHVVGQLIKPSDPPPVLLPKEKL